MGIAFLLLVPRAFAQTPIAFPKDGGVLDVRDFGAKPDDSGDDTAGIQKALDAFPNGNRIIHLPAGAWIVTDTLRWPKGEGGSRPSSAVPSIPRRKKED